MISNVKEALMCSLWVAENHPQVTPELWGGNEMKVLQMALMNDQQELWKKAVLCLGIEYCKKVWEWQQETGRDGQVLLDAIVSVESKINQI